MEVVALRARATAAAGSGEWPSVPPRRAGVGPTTIADPDTTIYVPDGWVGRVGALGALVLERAEPGSAS